MTSPERQPPTPEVKTADLEAAAAERSRELQKAHAEKAGEQPHESAEKALEAAKAEASKEKHREHEDDHSEHKHEAEKAPSVASKKTRSASYKRTMNRVQQDMNAPARTFSKIIHNPVVERTSDFVGNTVARPNAILSGSVAAFIVVAALYAMARYVGFSLSGFETIAAFAIGWLLGIVFDFLRVMITGKP